MNNKRIRLLILLGLITIIGIIVIQLMLFKEAFNLEEKKFSQKVHVGLLEVVKNLSNTHQNKIPLSNPINQISTDYYVVNINYDINPKTLDVYLKNEFEKLHINTDYEYAVYDCETDKMVYGNYVNYNTKNQEQKASYFPKFENLVYYFAVRFPNKTNYFFSSLKTWIILSLILLIILIIYVYSIFTILQQKRYSELQKDFINNMTHEFKTPLSSILIASDYLSHQPSIITSPKLKKYTETIVLQSKRLNKNVERILDLAKYEKNPLILEKSKVNIVETMQLVIDNFKIKHNNALTINFEIDKAEYFILADEIHFSNVIYNIIENSIKYAIKQPIINIKVSEEKNRYKLEIIDNGKGISKKHLKNIFKKFFRVPLSNKEHVKGFGLGLFYVKNICDLHKWQIEVTSTENVGTNFSIAIQKFN